ncbi:hypothetical protein [Lyngbya aestuarii]
MVDIPGIKHIRYPYWDFDTYGGGTHRISLWSERKTKSLQGGGSCYEAET